MSAATEAAVVAPPAMGFEVEMAALRAAVRAVAPGASPHAEDGLLFIEAAADGTLRLSTWHETTTLSTTVAAVAHSAGRAAVPAKTLAAWLRLVAGGDGPCVVKVRGTAKGEGVLALRCGASEVDLPLVECEPAVWDLALASRAELTHPAWMIESGFMRAILAAVVFAASEEETRPILRSVMLRVEPSLLTAVATNGHRLAEAVFADLVAPLPAAVGELRIPPRAVKRVLQAARAVDVVQVQSGPEWVRFACGAVSVTARQCDGPYPNYAHVIPKDSGRAVVVDRAHLLRAIALASVVASRQTRRVHLSAAPGGVHGGEGVLRVAAHGDKGTASERVECEYAGEPIIIGANARYLTEVVSRVPTDRVRLEFTGPERAVKVLPVGPEQPVKLTFLAMPLRLLDAMKLPVCL